jgi:CheY-like chemotaxis protein
MARVLLIEDDLFLRDIYADYLKGDGHDVEVAVDGMEGLAKATGGNWDLVLVDDNLPKLMGIDVLRQARMIQPPVAKHIVFLTNEQMPTDQNDDRLKLSDAYLIKSEYAPQELMDRLREYLV